MPQTWHRESLLGGRLPFFSGVWGQDGVGESTPKLETRSRVQVYTCVSELGRSWDGCEVGTQVKSRKQSPEGAVCWGWGAPSSREAGMPSRLWPQADLGLWGDRVQKWWVLCWDMKTTHVLVFHVASGGKEDAPQVSRFLWERWQSSGPPLCPWGLRKEGVPGS